MQSFERLLLVLLAVLPFSVAAPTQAQDGVATDKAALVALYTATGGADWTTKTKWTSEESLSAWSGVTTNGDGRVTRLVLNNNGLDGTLPSALGDLSALEWLNLEDNALSGALPSELTHLTHLQMLLLERSRALTGPLPDGLRELADLATVQIRDTELCAPEDDTFQAWWETITKTGLICPPVAQSVIDVAVFYTPTVRDDAGGTAQIGARIDVIAAETNTAYTNSGINQRINLVAVEELDYTEVHYQTDLRLLTSPEVRAIVDRVAADLTILIRQRQPADGNVAGLASSVSSPWDPFERYLYAVSTASTRLRGFRARTGPPHGPVARPL